MHDYTAWQVHEDRIRALTRDADAYRLAAIAKQGRTRRNRAQFFVAGCRSAFPAFHFMPGDRGRTRRWPHQILALRPR